MSGAANGPGIPDDGGEMELIGVELDSSSGWVQITVVHTATAAGEPKVKVARLSPTGAEELREKLAKVLLVGGAH